jgi:hypothetical protein
MNRHRCCADVIIIALFAAISAAAQARAADSPASESVTLNTLTKAEKDAGWKLLFDGKTAAGWRNYRKKDTSDKWSVVDGALTAKEGAGDLITAEQYDAFELVLDYKISKGGNSGVMFHVTEEGKQSYETGPEIQIYDHPGGPGVQKTGFLYQMYDSKVDSTKPAGEWNQMRLLITPEKCETSINGVKYYEYVIGSDDWNKRAAAGKFSKWPGFGKQPKGFICLQEHGGGVAFRNIKIRPISKK